MMMMLKDGRIVLFLVPISTPILQLHQYHGWYFGLPCSSDGQDVNPYHMSHDHDHDDP